MDLTLAPLSRAGIAERAFALMHLTKGYVLNTPHSKKANIDTATLMMRHSKVKITNEITLKTKMDTTCC